MGCIFFAQRPRPRMTYAGASAILSDPFADQTGGLYGAHHFSRKNVKRRRARFTFFREKWWAPERPPVWSAKGALRMAEAPAYVMLGRCSGAKTTQPMLAGAGVA